MSASTGRQVDPALVDLLAEDAHASWMVGQLAAGKTSVTSRVTGQELMVEWPLLDERDRDVDRVVARSTIATLTRRGLLAMVQVDGSTPPPSSVNHCVDRVGRVWRGWAGGPWSCRTDTFAATVAWPDAWRDYGPMTPLVPAITIGEDKR